MMRCDLTSNGHVGQSRWGQQTQFWKRTDHHRTFYFNLNSNPMLLSNENDGYVTLKVFKIQNKISLFNKYFSYHYILMR
jgi:hypothetical protein